MSLPYYPCHENKISTPDTHSGTRPDLELLKILSKQDEESEECWSPPTARTVAAVSSGVVLPVTGSGAGREQDAL